MCCFQNNDVIRQENVDGFMKKEGYETAESTLKNLDEQHQKYKFMELNLLGKKRR